MPNGGSDCCGTCWFNKKNKGKAGYDHAQDAGQDYCIIRDLDIDNAFYTYCANHPHRSPDREPVPIGPVFTGNSLGQRELSVQSPDTEEIRKKLLSLLPAIQEKPKDEYPAGAYRDETIIWQLGEFLETRALADLRRIANFDLEAKSDGRIPRTRAKTVSLAKEAIAQIESQNENENED